MSSVLELAKAVLPRSNYEVFRAQYEELSKARGVVADMVLTLTDASVLLSVSTALEMKKLELDEREAKLEYEVATKVMEGLRAQRKRAEEVCSWCCDTADVDLQIEKGSRYCARCGNPLTGSGPKRPALPDGYEWVPETEKEWSEGMMSYPKPTSIMPREWVLRGGPAVLSHDLFWYCRPVKPDCDAEFEKWWVQRSQSCPAPIGSCSSPAASCEECRELHLRTWRAARGQ